MTAFVWLVGGEAGFGIKEAGLIFAKTCSRAGLNVFGYTEYPSLIRGGHNTYQVTADSEALYSQHGRIDILVALNRDTVDMHRAELSADAVVLYDADIGRVDNALAVPFLKIARDMGFKDIVRNTVALGASMAIVGLDFSRLEDVLNSEFRHKGNEIAEMNISAARAGYDYVMKNFKPKKLLGKVSSQTLEKFDQKNAKKKLVLTGNEALGLGAIQAGCKLYAGYPMTPVTPLLHFIAAHADKHGIALKVAEDEIEAVNMAVGASAAGARSMTASSGGGFCLMIEGYGLAGMTETPLVIVEGQRPGPSSGLPTWTTQGDLKFLLDVSHGEFPRIVLAPGDMSECFYKIADAFNLSDRYQTPVIVVVDKYLVESHASVDVFDTKKIRIDRGKMAAEPGRDFRRYAVTPDGISPRSIPGQKDGMFIANSYEHDEYGFYTEDQATVKKMQDKRMRKVGAMLADIPEPEVYGSGTDVVMVGWGSTKMPALEAVKMLASQGVKASYVHYVYVKPFKTKALLEAMKKARAVLLVEGNATAQLGQVIRQNALVKIENTLLRYDGRPIYPEDIAKKAKELLKL